MKTERINLVYFSPTGSTKRVLQFIGRESNLQVAEFDYTDYRNRDMKLNFASTDLVIFGIPVYSGRVPGAAALRLRNVSGNGTPAVLIATYGNREYEDALIELKDITEQNGFMAIAAAAVVTEHSIVRTIAKGRPDSSDFKSIADFTTRFLKQPVESASLSVAGNLFIKGNHPYREFKPVPLIPQAGPGCNRCGICAAACPVNAIPEDEPEKTDKDLCISCMRCVRVCPNKSRSLKREELLAAESFLLKQCKTEKHPEFFYKYKY